jgi:RNA polymerase sigma-70 factor (ECF subfamily)
MLRFGASTVLGVEDEILNALILDVAKESIYALEELYNITKTGIYSFALSVLKNPRDAEGVLHNTFLSIWKSAYMYPEKNPTGWLITIAQNHCYGVLRDRKWRDNQNDDVEMNSFNAEANYKPLVWKYLDSLGDDERKIIVLRVIAGFKYGEIADFLNISFTTLLLKYNKSVKKLKKLLAQEGDFYE